MPSLVHAIVRLLQGEPRVPDAEHRALRGGEPGPSDVREEQRDGPLEAIRASHKVHHAQAVFAEHRVGIWGIRGRELEALREWIAKHARLPRGDVEHGAKFPGAHAPAVASHAHPARPRARRERRGRARRRFEALHERGREVPGAAQDVPAHSPEMRLHAEVVQHRGDDEARHDVVAVRDDSLDALAQHHGQGDLETVVARLGRGFERRTAGVFGLWFVDG